MAHILLTSQVISEWVPNTLIEGHIPWFRDPKPKGTNPKGPKENPLKLLEQALKS